MAINQLGNTGSLYSNSGTSGQLTSAQQAQSTQSDQNQTELISAQMQSEQTKTQAQIHQINEETNTKVSDLLAAWYQWTVLALS